VPIYENGIGDCQNHTGNNDHIPTIVRLKSGEMFEGKRSGNTPNATNINPQ
jgi:hypothetical protein